MRYYSLSIQRLAGYILAAVFVADIAIICIAYAITHDWRIFGMGGVITAVSILGTLVLLGALQKKLSHFTSEICLTLEEMILGDPQEKPYVDEETLLGRIMHRLQQLHHVMQKQKEAVYVERKELQQLVSDISHQTKTPVTNLKMIQETMLGSELSDEERLEFLNMQGTQIEKLDFLVQAMVKTSRLETGMIVLQKEKVNLYETIAEAVGQIFVKARQKEMEIQVDCPEKLLLFYDRKWTAEAIFNVLDNAVKYTPKGGRIRISAERWEAYTRLDIEDNGRGIPEGSYARVFQRFYREQDVHDAEGVGIGLYLAREIITMQGGYMRVQSRYGEGSVFSIFLSNDYE